MSINRDSDDDVPINPDNDADVTICLDSDTDIPTNLDDHINVPANLDNDANVPINLDMDDDSFQASNDIITDDYEDRVLAEIIQEIWNEPENIGVEPMLSLVPGVAKKGSHDEMNGTEQNTIRFRIKKSG